ncbi:MAG: hypothetical protein GY854_18130 [Deltaproteobacteria bacterium]|nr:hypothetical protein [Deltaproteobacteria bacterium]
MARVNEFKTNGGAFADPNEAMNALESYLEEIEQTGDMSITKLDREKNYRSNISGLKNCFSNIVGKSVSQLKKLGLNTSFIQIAEEMQQERFAEQVSFRYPVYEHVWLTDPDGKDVGEELLPFLVYNLEYIKEEGRVTVSVVRLNTKLNLPELRTSFKAAREDIDLVRKETEFVATVHRSAEEMSGKFTAALEQLCAKENLQWEASDSAVSLLDDVDSLQSQEFAEDDNDEPEIVDVDDIDDTD